MEITWFIFWPHQLSHKSICFQSKMFLVHILARYSGRPGHYNNVGCSARQTTSFVLNPVTEDKYGTFPFLSFPPPTNGCLQFLSPNPLNLLNLFHPLHQIYVHPPTLQFTCKLDLLICVIMTKITVLITLISGFINYF